MMFEKKLTLKKTHDFSQVENPRLTVVFVHGIATNSSSFDSAIKYLEGTRSLKDVRFVTFDLLGSGQSLKSDRLDYGFKDQLTALHNSLLKLKIKTPLVLVGHSMGTLIVSRYANQHKKIAQQLILVSPPIYTESDLDNPAFKAGIKVFTDAVSIRNRKIIEEKSFKNSMSKIVLSRHNYDNFVNLAVPTVLIYGNMDQFIASYNIPKLLKANTNLSAIKTEGRHGVSRDKYTKMVGILEENLNAQTI